MIVPHIRKIIINGNGYRCEVFYYLRKHDYTIKKTGIAYVFAHKLHLRE